ncbi:MAG: hypothetical protein MAG453_02005 [Calditrichaeota bacterium]|nr:hypothetical protein [Calditrichota bacterium]
MSRGIGLFLLFFVPALAAATIIEVPGDYGDIQDAINASADGDTILVDPGTYAGTYNFNGHHVVLASRYLTTGNESFIDDTVLDGENAGTVITIENLGVTDAAVIGFTIENGFGAGDWPNVHGGGMHVMGSSVSVEHCVFRNCETTGQSNRGAGIYYGSEDGGYIGYCTFHDLTSYFGAAIAIANDSFDILIEHCEAFDTENVAGFADKGSFMVTYSDEVTFYRCLAHNNDGSGFRVWGASVMINHCTAADNTGYGIAGMYFETDLTVTNTIAWGDNYGVYQDLETTVNCTYSDLHWNEGDPWFGEGCFDEDPLFMDPFEHDYSLTEDSPCIDAGDPDGEWDPDDTPPDVGAIWSPQGPPPPVQLTLSPQNAPIEIPAEGGTFTYDAEIVSTLPQIVQGQAWTSVTLPNGQLFEPLMVTPVFIPPGTTEVYNLQQAVPGLAPAGAYTFHGKLGFYPGFVATEDSFEFTKLGAIAGGGGEWNGEPWRELAREPAGAAGDITATAPSGFALSPAFPNPFNPSTTLTVTLPEAAELTVTAYNAAGRIVAELTSGAHPAGTHSFTFDASALASGLYFVRATVPGRMNEVRKLLLVR